MITSRILACSNEKISVLSWDGSWQYFEQVVLAVMGQLSNDEEGVQWRRMEVRSKYVVMWWVLIQMKDAWIGFSLRSLFFRGPKSSSGVSTASILSSSILFPEILSLLEEDRAPSDLASQVAISESLLNTWRCEIPRPCWLELSMLSRSLLTTDTSENNSRGRWSLCHRCKWTLVLDHYLVHV